MKKGFLKNYRCVSGFLLQELSEREFMLYVTLTNEADWDPKHVYSFGTVRFTLQKFKDRFLPKWSMAKMSGVRKSLAQKRFIEILAPGLVRITLFPVYQTRSMQKVEELLEKLKNRFSYSEDQLQDLEEEERQALLPPRLKSTGKFNFSAPNNLI